MSPTSATSSDSIQIPTLTYGTYSRWVGPISGKLQRAMVWRFCSGEMSVYPKPSDPRPLPNDASAVDRAAVRRDHREDMRSYEESITRNDKAIGIIKEHLAPEQLILIEKLTSAKDVWTKLKEAHAGTTAGLEAFYIKRGMMDKRYEHGDNMQDHINFYSLENKKLSDTDAFGDQFLAELMLASLPRTVDDSPNTWETFTIVTLAAITETNKLTSSFVTSRLIAEYRRLTSGDDSSEAANAAAVRGKSKPKKKPKKGPLCSYCHKGPHLVEDCNHKKRDEEASRRTASAPRSSGRSSRKPTAAAAQHSDSDSSSDEEVSAKVASTYSEFPSVRHSSSDSVHVFISTDVATFLAKTSNDESYIDSGCSRHLSPRRDWFEDSSYTKLDKPVPIHLGDASTIYAVGKGTLQYLMDTPDGVITGFLPNTLHVPDLAATLISVSQLTDKCKHTILFDGEECFVKARSSGRCVASGRKTKGGLYLLHARPLKSQEYANLATTSRYININHAHRCLGHLGQDNIKRLIAKGMVTGIDEVGGRIEFCESCTAGKQHVFPFPSSNKRARRKLDLVHSDVCGPLPNSINGGYRYFITFIDDNTHHCWVYFLHHKSEAYRCFREWKAMVELETGLKLKVFRTDNGGEYTSDQFEDYLRNLGIIHETTVPHTPQQNGVAERFNRTIVERARCMMHDAKFTAGFWVFAVIIAVYLINRSPTSRLPNSTPHEAWSGVKPSLKELKPFGCPAYAHIPKLKRKKLDFKTRKCIFIGYKEHTKGYLLWDPKKRKTFVSRDVIFDERPHPPGPPLPIPDLSQILYNGEVPGDGLPGFSRVGDAWEDISPPVTPAVPHPPAPSSEVDSEDNVGNSRPYSPDLPPPNDPPPAPPARRRRTELELLGPVPEVDGPRARRLPARFREEPDIPPDPPQPPEAAPGDRPDVAEGVAMAFVATVHAQGASEPRTLQEALRGPDSASWLKAVDKELKSLIDMGTFEFIDNLPKGRRAISSKLVFKIKRLPDGTIERYKARLVARGFSQMPGLDFDEVFSPVVKLTSIRVLCALAVRLGLHFHHLDVDTAFLNGELEEELYMRLPNGISEHSGKIVRLRRSIYGLKQASRVWNKLLDAELEKLGFRRIHADYCIYVLQRGKSICFIAVYVDDIGILCDDLKFMQEIKHRIGQRFKIKDLGVISQLLGIAIDYDQEKRVLRLSQTRYIEESLKRFHCDDGITRRTPLSSGVKLSKADSPSTDAEKEAMADRLTLYQALIGTLMYAMLASRPDIAFAVGILSRYCSNPGEIHLNEALHCLRYLGGTKDWVIEYDGTIIDELISLILGYSDSDWAGDVDTRRSTSGYVFLMCGAAISWSSKLQTSPALSSTEAEYMALTRTAQEAIWLRQLLEQLGFQQTKPTRLLGDNMSSIALSKNPADHPRTKHIQLCHHFIRFAISDGQIDLEYVPTAQQAADGLTKGLSGEKHMAFVRMLGMKPRPSGSVKSR